MNKNLDRVFRLLLLTAAGLGIFGGAVVGAQTPAPTPAGNAENGKKLFTTYACYSCHGSLGRAGGAAPAIVPVLSADALIKYVRKPGGNMPAYTSKSISDRELIDIQAYLATIPKDVDAKAIPLLQNLNTP